MRKLCFVLTALLLTAPALATITISCAQVGETNEVVVSYVSSDANIPRAFGLDITLDNGATIGEITDANDKFWVHPGNILIVDGNVTDEGDPVAPQDGNYPGRELGGLGTGGMTIEMGSLYSPNDLEHPTGPGTSGTLLSFIVDIGPGEDCNVTIAGNGARGNVVLENTDPAATNLPTICAVVIPPEPECLKSSAPGYADWTGHPVGVAWAMPWSNPDCWCYPRQCRGDADGAPSYPGVPIWVDLADLNILRGAISHYVTGPTDPGFPAGGECANFDHQMSYPGVPIPVDLADLNILREYISDYGTVPCCDNNQDCVLDASDDYNFWTGSTTP